MPTLANMQLSMMSLFPKKETENDYHKTPLDIMSLKLVWIPKWETKPNYVLQDELWSNMSFNTVHQLDSN